MALNRSCINNLNLNDNCTAVVAMVTHLGVMDDDGVAYRTTCVTILYGLSRPLSFPD